MLRLVAKSCCGSRRSLSNMTSFYDLVDKDMNGNPVPMSNYQNQMLCIVNVASA
jgi:hypothetical protein